MTARLLCPPLLILFAALAFWVPARADNAELISRYDAEFPKYDKPLAPSEEYGRSLAWGESYLLMSLMDMAQATGDTKYLDWFVRRFDAALALRDNVLGRQDEFRHLSLPVWGSVRYSDGKYHDWAVHTGMITYPAAEFAQYVRSRPELAANYGGQAEAYLEACKQAVAAHEIEWLNGPAKDEGYYCDFYLRAHLPLNQQNALGRTLVVLWLITDDKGYRDKAERLARFFSRRLRARPDGSYDWAYWAGLCGPEPYRGGPSEDISHAAINADFAALCARHDLVFTAKDMRSFARTFTGHIYQGEGTFADTVGGKLGANAYVGALPGWLALGEWEPKVWEIVWNFERSSGGPKAVRDIAALVRWKPRPAAPRQRRGSMDEQERHG